jgi:hypothetical protein
MFDITPDDIFRLNDVDLRELVGRLCEAELESKGLSASAATWGGNQTAADGGLDVRVALPSGVPIEGFIPRCSTGFQVKKPDMARANIITEMQPSGAVRPVIRELATEAGAYIIVSSTASTSDSVLRNRRNAMREALGGMDDAGRLYTDFYDRTRLATWVRRHPGLITWVKEKVGNAVPGWHPYGPWSGTSDGVNAEYLLDDRLRLHLDRHPDAPAQSVADAIDNLRDELAKTGKILRLVGLSVVGKTRLVEALFDVRIGARALPPSLAIYTDLSDNPDPQPTGLASDLIANRTRAILIVDNCPPDLHRRLSDLCSRPESTVSVLTVEYDVRDDQPEGTEVIRLDTSSPELIEKLVQRRYSQLSQVDARTIAEVSGGNARIANALAQTVERGDTIAGLSDDELFQRLFRQRQESNNGLFLAAQACSLVYSFQGEALTGDDAELARLAALSGQTATEIYRYVSELRRRDLVQQRGDWRAVLPHAIANRLATLALEDTPYDLIDQQLLSGRTERLARSFSRRLSYLHDSPKAVAIVKRWLSPNGMLADVTSLDEVGRAMFENVAPVLPEATLVALERVYALEAIPLSIEVQRHLPLLRSIAYDAPLFERSAGLLARIAATCSSEIDAKKASDIFVSLFTIHISGTHATIAQRLSLVRLLLTSGVVKERELGLAALRNVLEALHFHSSYQFDFGARSRDYGYHPESHAEVTGWYGAALALIESLALTSPSLKTELLTVLSQQFRGLWTSANIYDELERLFHLLAADGFWREGWAACRQTMHFDRAELVPEAATRLTALESDLRPVSLQDQVRAFVLGSSSGGLDFEDLETGGDAMSATERLETIAFELGASVAGDERAFTELLSELLLGGNKAWSFGSGLAEACKDPRAVWARLTERLEQTDPEKRDIQILRGFLVKLRDKNESVAQQILDLALDHPVTQTLLPALQSTVGIDERGIGRLRTTLEMGTAPVWMFRYLAFGRTTDNVPGDDLRQLLRLIADQPEGFDVALEILTMRLFSDASAKREHETELLVAGRELLTRVPFRKNTQRKDHELAQVARACLITPDAGPVAAEIAARLSEAMADYATYWSLNDDLLKELFKLQPAAVLDGLFGGEGKPRWAEVGEFEQLRGHGANPVDEVSGETLINWCNRNPDHRFSLAASIITFASPAPETGSRDWSAQAKALLAAAPDPRPVLTVFVGRFRPRSWSGSRAALMEANLRLLESVGLYVPAELMSFVSETQSHLAKDVARERDAETKQDRARDERFE